MRKIICFLSALSVILLFSAVPLMAGPEASLSSTTYKAGHVVKITGTIAPGSNLYIAIAQRKMFAPEDTKGEYETVKFKKMEKKKGFAADTKIPPL